MIGGPLLVLYLLFWLVIVPGGLYMIIRTAVEHGIRRARREPDPRPSAAAARQRQDASASENHER